MVALTAGAATAAASELLRHSSAVGSQPSKSLNKRSLDTIRDTVDTLHDTVGSVKESLGLDSLKENLDVFGLFDRKCRAEDEDEEVEQECETTHVEKCETHNETTYDFECATTYSKECRTHHEIVHFTSYRDGIQYCCN